MMNENAEEKKTQNPMSQEVLTKERVAEIKKRATDAQPWDWRDCGIHVDPDGYVHAAACSYIGDTLIVLSDTYEGYQEDWTFVAHAREDMPDLCASHEALRAELDVVKGAHQSRTEFCAQLRQRAEAAEAGAASALQAAKKISDEWDEEFKCVCGRKGHYVEADTVDDMLEACKAGSAFLARHKRILSELHNQHLYHKAMLEAVASEKFLAEAAECHREQIAAIELALREEAL